MLLAALAVGVGCTSRSTDTDQDGSTQTRVAAVVDDIKRNNRDVRAMSVWARDKPVVERYFDGSPRETSDVASITKSVMSILIGIAIDDGAIRDVQQPLARLLPSYAPLMTPALRKATLHQVLTMTVGLPHEPADGPLPTARDWVKATMSTKLAHPPGHVFSYSNQSSHLLSAILVQATGRSVLDFAREKLFDPLGIDSRPAAQPLAKKENAHIYDSADFAWPVDPQHRHLGWGFLKMRAPDLVKIGRLMLAEGHWHGKQIVSRKWVAQSTRSQVSLTHELTSGYGYQWWVTTADGHPAYAAVGCGGQLVEVVPNLELVTVTFTRITEMGCSPAGVPLRMVDQIIAPLLSTHEGASKHPQ